MQQSQLQMHLTRPAHQSSLSSTHSVLAKSLMEEPRMTPEQMKRTDIIHNYIKRESAAEAAYRSPHHPGGLLVCSPASAPSACPYPASRWPVITTARQQTPSPSDPHHYFQSPHSTSTSPPGPSPSSSSSSASPRLIELQVDIADPQQPLNLSKKSPTPPPAAMRAPLIAQAVSAPAPAAPAHKLLLEA